MSHDVMLPHVLGYNHVSFRWPFVQEYWHGGHCVGGASSLRRFHSYWQQGLHHGQPNKSNWHKHRQSLTSLFAKQYFQTQPQLATLRDFQLQLLTIEKKNYRYIRLGGQNLQPLGLNPRFLPQLRKDGTTFTLSRKLSVTNFKCYSCSLGNSSNQKSQKFGLAKLKCYTV